MHSALSLLSEEYGECSVMSLVRQHMHSFGLKLCADVLSGR